MHKYATFRGMKSQLQDINTYCKCLIYKYLRVYWKRLRGHFQDRRIRPLCHPSRLGCNLVNESRFYKIEDSHLSHPAPRRSTWRYSLRLTAVFAFIVSTSSTNPFAKIPRTGTLLNVGSKKMAYGLRSMTLSLDRSHWQSLWLTLGCRLSPPLSTHYRRLLLLL